MVLYYGLRLLFTSTLLLLLNTISFAQIKSERDIVSTNAGPELILIAKKNVLEVSIKKRNGDQKLRANFFNSSNKLILSVVQGINPDQPQCYSIEIDILPPGSYNVVFLIGDYRIERKFIKKE